MARNWRRVTRTVLVVQVPVVHGQERIVFGVWRIREGIILLDVRSLRMWFWRRLG